MEEDIGYIRFNTFHPELIPELEAAVQSMEDAPGIIADLRGCPTVPCSCTPSSDSSRPMVLTPNLTTPLPFGRETPGESVLFA